ncbi:MAG: hypothetical protein M3Z41_02265, partial [Candidatus Eremiobacteraeota bacterium]|nr:hypothetical protein [Candidatus Eremiobacteraeota bacterium]
TINQWNDLADNVAENVAETADELAKKTADVTRKASQTQPAKTMQHASQRVENVVSNSTANALWRSVFLGAAGVAAVASLGLMLGNRKPEALYIGQWVPTLTIVALWAQVVKD